MRASSATLQPVTGAPFAPEARKRISEMIVENAPVTLTNFQVKPFGTDRVHITADRVGARPSTVDAYAFLKRVPA